MSYQSYQGRSAPPTHASGAVGLSAFQQFAKSRRIQDDDDASQDRFNGGFPPVPSQYQQPTQQQQQQQPTQHHHHHHHQQSPLSLINSNTNLHPNIQLAHMQLRILKASNRSIEVRRLIADSIEVQQQQYATASSRGSSSNTRDDASKEAVDSNVLSTASLLSSKRSSNSLNAFKSAATNAKYAAHMKGLLNGIRTSESKNASDNQVVAGNEDSSDDDEEEEEKVKPKSKIQEMISDAKKSQQVKPNEKQQARQAEENRDDITAMVQRTAKEQMIELQKSVGSLVDEYKKSIQESQEGVERNKENEVKKKLRHILKKEGKGASRMPLWRHKLAGNNNPPPELVLKGKHLFYVVARGVIVLIVRPQLSIDKRKRESKKKFKAELNRSLIFYGGICDKWMAQNLKTPINSTSKDEELDFKFYGKDRKKSLESRSLQLKVRIKAITQAVVSCGSPDDHILDFFIDLIDDGNYFDMERYLFTCERTNLEFDKYDGTRNMIRIVGVNDIDLKNKYIVNIDGIYVDTTRVHMMISNFLIIKTLINHLLLSPWNHGLCSKPSKLKICSHFRLISSVFYEITRASDPSKLPPIATKVRSDANERGDEESRGNFKKGSFLAAFFPANDGEKERRENQKIMETLLSVRPIYGSLSELHSILFSPDPFWIAARPYIDSWAPEIAASLRDWISDIVFKVIHRRFKKVAEEEGVDDVSRLNTQALLKELPEQRENYQTPRDRKKTRLHVAETGPLKSGRLAVLPELDLSNVSSSEK